MASQQLYIKGIIAWITVILYSVGQLSFFLGLQVGITT